MVDLDYCLEKETLLFRRSQKQLSMQKNIVRLSACLKRALKIPFDQDNGLGP